MSNYIFQSELMRERGSDKDYSKMREVAGAFEAVSELPESFSGNCYSGMHYDLKTEKVKITKYDFHDETKISPCEMLPSSHVLYSLLCMYQCKVHSEGPDGYKGVWSVALKHKESGQVVVFREWKGAFSLGCSNMFEESTARDMCKLVELMVKGQVLHPYDGTFAGSVA